MAVIMGRPALQGLRRFSLTTGTHARYAQFGFEVVGNPGRQMEILRPQIYLSSPS